MMTEFPRSAALALLCGLLSAAASADNGVRFYAKADNQAMANRLGHYAGAMDADPGFRAKYPKDRYMIVGQGSGMLADDASGGFCSAQFQVFEYTKVNDILVVPLAAALEGKTQRNLRWGNGFISEGSFMDGCARAAAAQIWR